MKIRILLAAIVAATSLSAQAAGSIHLGNYQVVGTYGLDILNGTSGGISGLEASAVTYARDRGTLFYVGDEGTVSSRYRSPARPWATTSSTGAAPAAPSTTPKA